MDLEESTYLFLDKKGGELSINAEEVDQSSENEEVEEIKNYDKINRNAGLLPTSFNLVNGAIGVGIVSLPYAISLNGILQGIVLVIILPIISSFTLYLLSQVIQRSKELTYEDSTKLVFGKSVVYKFLNPVLILVMLLIPLGSQVAYLILVNDQIMRMTPLLFDDYAIIAQYIVFTLVTCFVVFPLCCLKSTKSLSYTSFLTMMSALYLSVLLVVNYVIIVITERSLDIFEGVTFISTLNLFSFLKSLPLIIFSGCAHQVCFSIFPEMKNPTKVRSATTVMIETVSILSIYIPSCIAGYLTYKEGSEPDIVKNLEVFSIFTIIARVALALVGCFSFPLQLFILRRTINQLIFSGFPASYYRDLMTTVVLMTLSYFLAIFVPWIDICMDFVGSIGMNSILYILPPILFVQLQPKKSRIFIVTIILYLLSICGIVSLVICTIVSTISFMQKYI